MRSKLDHVEKESEAVNSRLQSGGRTLATVIFGLDILTHFIYPEIA